MTLSVVKNLILTSPELDTIRQKMDQALKQQSKKQIQKVMQKQAKGIRDIQGKLWGHSSTKKIQISESTTNRQASRRRRIHKSTSFHKIFNYQVSNYIFCLCYACNNFGHKAMNCRANSRNSNNFESYTQRYYSRRPSETQRRSYNRFESLST